MLPGTLSLLGLQMCYDTGLPCTVFSLDVCHKIFFLKMDRRSEHFAKKDIKIANKHMENYHRCYQEMYAKGHHSNS